jgi:hypothetical protein
MARSPELRSTAGPLFVERRADGSCADCGRWTASRAVCVDVHTHSEVELCGNCVPAFLQRQQFPPGCCG